MHSYAIRGTVVTMAIVLFGSGPISAQSTKDARISLEQLRQQRSQMLKHRRRIIANNDGCDCLYFPKNQEITVDNFLRMRTSELAETQVDTIAYCTISSGFSHFTHNTRVGTLLTRQGEDYGILPNMRNITADLVNQGTDALAAVVQYGHEHEMEVFWSMRMNDTHDAAHRPEKPYFLFPPLKEKHPQWLIGEPTKRPPHGTWSSVNYEIPEVRDLACQYIEEVCRDDDVDGIELDFFRHLCYFKSVAYGGKATAAQCAMMTELLRRVRRVTEKEGCRRGRPFLVAVRVPDSPGFCRDMGFDLRAWLQEGLVDILITTGYFRLNPWQDSVQLGHQYDVAVYPCLSDSRVLGESRFRRASLPSYRGRAMNAWLAGGDGIDLFNFFNPKSPLWREIGEQKTLVGLDKLYFVTVRDGDPNRYLAHGDAYRTVPILTPSHPAFVSAQKPLSTTIVVGEDFAASRKAGYKPSVTLHLQLSLAHAAKRVEVQWNDKRLTGGKEVTDWLDFPVPVERIERGTNNVRISFTDEPDTNDSWNVVYRGNAMPERPWSRDRGSAHTEQKMVEDALMIADRGTNSGDYLYQRFCWGLEPEAEAVVEASVKVISGSSYLIMANGVGGERLQLAPDHIALYHHPKLRFDMDTTQEFHTYRVVLKGANLKVYVDNMLRIDAAGKYTPRAGYPRNELAFGAANSTDVGAAFWKSVKVRTTNASCQDVVLSVKYQKP